MEDITQTRVFKAIRNSLASFMKNQFEETNQKRMKLGLEVLKDRNKPLIMSCIDTYHPISGLINKLKSYLMFLEKYPNYRDKIILV